MHETPDIVVDTFSEIYPLIQHRAADEFWDLNQHTIKPGAVYVIGRQQGIQHAEIIQSIVDQVQIVISNPHEGSSTLIGTLQRMGLLDLAQQGKIWLVGGGDMSAEYRCLRYDKFLPEILDYEENSTAALSIDEIYAKQNKPYKFLFLNGRCRWHRGRLLNMLNDILDTALWSNLDAGNGAVKTLPTEYEVPRYQNNSITDNYVKFELFNNEWGEIYLHPAPYIDTYFSLVTETVFDVPYSFRTEKIWKPIAMGHPWIAVANRGFYRDMHNLGFQTYSHIIDESFDLIDNNEDRLSRIADIVRDLCTQDLAAFLRECYNVSKYNQQHHRELAARARQEFPERFFQFINE
jgi:hypothetical protein